jgi:chromosome transmission fidelity protein 4
LQGAGTIVAYTSKGYLRFWSLTGVRKDVWDVGSGVVSIAAGKETIWVYKEVAGRGEYLIIDTDRMERVQQGDVPAGTGKEVRWIGWSEDEVG